MTARRKRLSLLVQVQQCRSQILRIRQFVMTPDDLFQDTYLACSSKKNVDWSIPHPDYIMRSAKDQISRLCRRASSQCSSTSLESLQFEIADLHDDRDLRNREVDFENLHLALELLPENHRLVITKHGIDGISFSRLANELGVKECTVRQRWRRGLNYLRQSPLLSDSRRRH